MFCKLALANKDVETALLTCNTFIQVIMQWKGKMLPLEIAEAFIATIIVSYSRPFVQTSNSFPGELPKSWHKFADKRLEAIHKEMLEHRHSLFAHTDPTIHKISIVPDGCLPKNLGPKPPQIAYIINGVQIPPQNVVRFKAVCEDLQQRLEVETQKLLYELYEGLELPRRKFTLKYDEGL